MKIKVQVWCWVLLAAFEASLLKASLADVATGREAMVATVNALATDAGIAALDRGGNAIDAAIAAAVTLGVVDGYNSGLGGGCFILVRHADGRIIAIDGRETAPMAATRGMFLVDGQADPNLSKTGALAVGTPGALAAYESLSKQSGNLPLADHLTHAADIAESGFTVDAAYASRLVDLVTTIKQFRGTREMLLMPDGQPYRAGELLKLPDLAHTYRQIAIHGIDWFYRGPMAEKIGAWMQQNGGLLTADDFARYQVKSREPIRTTYRGYEIIGFPPPSSGGVHVAQILNILEPFDLKSLFRDDPAAAYHLIAEAMKLAFADRAYWLGDPDFVAVPEGLIAKKYARELSSRIRMDGVIKVPGHGQPPDFDTAVFGKHTTHIATADRAGNWVAITATINTSFGSKVVVPGTGLILNNEMDDFSAQPGKPNAFGLVGAEFNEVAPGKRPLSSMSPTIVIKDNQPVLSVGAAGGPKIISQVLLTLVHHLDAGLSLDKNLASSRIHHQWSPDRLFVEGSLDESVVKQLASRGHVIEVSSSSGVTQAIVRDEHGEFTGVADPRVQGKAQGR